MMWLVVVVVGLIGARGVVIRQKLNGSALSGNVVFHSPSQGTIMTWNNTVGKFVIDVEAVNMENSICRSVCGALEHSLVLYLNNDGDELGVQNILRRRTWILRELGFGDISVCIQTSCVDSGFICGFDCSTAHLVPVSRTADAKSVDASAFRDMILGESRPQVHNHQKVYKQDGNRTKVCMLSSSSTLDGIRTGWLGIGSVVGEMGVDMVFVGSDASEEMRGRLKEAGIGWSQMPGLEFSVVPYSDDVGDVVKEAMGTIVWGLLASVRTSGMVNAVCDGGNPFVAELAPVLRVGVESIGRLCGSVEGQRWLEAMGQSMVGEVKRLAGYLEREGCDVAVSAVSSSETDPVVVEIARYAKVPLILEDCGHTYEHSPWHLEGVSAVVAHSTVARDQSVQLHARSGVKVCRGGSAFDGHVGLNVVPDALDVGWCGIGDVDFESADHVPTPIVAINLGVNQKLWRRCDREAGNGKELIVGYFGRLSSEKGIGLVLHALEYALRSQKDIKLHIVGSGSSKIPLLQLVHALGITRSVMFFGSLVGEKLQTAVCGMDVVVIPSVRTETLGLVGMEAMTSGRGIVGYGTSGTADYMRRLGPRDDVLDDGLGGIGNVSVFGHAVVVHEPGDVEAFGKTLLALSLDRNLVKRMGSNGAAIADQFSNTKQSRTFASLWKCIASCRTSSSYPKRRIPENLTDSDYSVLYRENCRRSRKGRCGWDDQEYRECVYGCTSMS